MDQGGGAKVKEQIALKKDKYVCPISSICLVNFLREAVLFGHSGSKDMKNKWIDLFVWM